MDEDMYYALAFFALASALAALRARSLLFRLEFFRRVSFWTLMRLSILSLLCPMIFLSGVHLKLRLRDYTVTLQFIKGIIINMFGLCGTCCIVRVWKKIGCRQRVEKQDTCL